MMDKNHKSMAILIADDDEEDRMLIQDAIEEIDSATKFCFVKDGEELMDYLQHRGQYAAPESSPRPGIILLDLNMPKKDGREALQEIKSHPSLKTIPVIVLTTSGSETDIENSYDLGANTFISKPVTFDDLVATIEAIKNYWFTCVKLPPKT